jgi:hypothetical protein
MPQKVTEFELKFDPYTREAPDDKKSIQKKLMEASPKAFTFSVRHPISQVYLKKSGTGDIEVLFGVDRILGEMVPPLAEYRAFSKTEDLGYFKVDAFKTLVESSPDDDDEPIGAVPFNIAEYYTGKQRRADNGGGFEFQCKITIPKETWDAVMRLGAGIGIKQIEGILQQDPILISQKSKIQGVRCIKPEPYGWIFSTSVSNRLVAKNVSISTVNPTALIFDRIESGH